VQWSANIRSQKVSSNISVARFIPRLGWSTISVELRSHGSSKRRRSYLSMWKFAWLLRQRRWSRQANRSRILPGGDAENRCDLVEPSWVGKEIVITAPIPRHASVLPTALFDRLNDDFNLPVAPAIRSVLRSASATASLIKLDVRSSPSYSRDGRKPCVRRSRLADACGPTPAKYCDSGACASAESSAHRLDQVRLRRVLDYIAANIETTSRLKLSPDSRATAHFILRVRSPVPWASRRTAM